MKADTFKRKYRAKDFSPMEVGKAVICSLVYTRLKAQELRLLGNSAPLTEKEETLFTVDRVREMLGTISTIEERRQYTAYRQLEEWLVSRQVQTVLLKSLLNTNLDSLGRTIKQIIWAETAEGQLEADFGEDRPGRDIIDNNLFLHKFDAARFAFDDGEEAEDYVVREDLQYTLKKIAQHNALIALIAKEIEIPELVDACSVPLKVEDHKIEAYNDLVAQARKQITDRGYSPDDNGIGRIKHGAFLSHLQPLEGTTYKVPAANRKKAQELLIGLDVFKEPRGGTILDKAIDGR